MHTFTVTDDQLHWLQVAVEHGIESAKRYGDDVDAFLDGQMLIERYTELQGIIGETDPIGLPDTE